MTAVKTFLTSPASDTQTAALAEFIFNFHASLDFRLWAELIKEESLEVEKAFKEEGREQQLKELGDLRYVLVGSALAKPQYLELLVKQGDTIETAYNEADRVFEAVIEKNADAFTKEQLDEAFDRIHISNMSKLGEDGKAILREDGKILKGPNYQPPVLTDLIDAEAA